MARASYRGGLPCPQGSFLDVGKGECWSCPKDYNRSAISAVDKPKACQAQNACAPGNVSVGNPVAGYTCYKKNACGKAGQRPCLVAERVPSCNKGLAEDFVANACVDEKIAACLTGVRALRFADRGKNKLSKAEEEAMKLARTAVHKLEDKIPGLKKAMNTANDESKKLIHKSEKLIRKELHKILPEAERMVSRILPVVEELEKAFHKNEKKIEHLLTSDAFCTMSNKKRLHTLTGLLGSGLSKIKLSQNDPDTQNGFADYIFGKKANAAVLNEVGLIIGFSARMQKNHLVFGNSIGYGFDYAGKYSKLFFGSSLALTSDPTFRPRFGPYLKLIPNKPRHWATTSFVSLGGVVNLFDRKYLEDLAKDYEIQNMGKILKYADKKRGTAAFAGAIGIVINWKDKQNPVSLGGIVLRPKLGQDKDKFNSKDDVKWTFDLNFVQMFPIAEF